MSETLPSPSFRPLYEQIKILLTQSLVAGEWKPGEAIPSEMELAGPLPREPGTVRKAIDELASEHIPCAARARAPSSPRTASLPTSTGSCA